MLRTLSVAVQAPLRGSILDRMKISTLKRRNPLSSKADEYRLSAKTHRQRPPSGDDVYTTLSDRFGDIFSVLGQLPDGFEDQWINAVLRDRQAVKNFSQRVEKARPPMELRYMREVADDHGLDWEYTVRFLSSRDLDEWMRQG